MVGVLWVPPPGGPPGILILRRQPAGIRCVRGASSGLLSEQDKSREGGGGRTTHVCVGALTGCCTLL